MANEPIRKDQNGSAELRRRVLLGTAVGDAYGLGMEGLPPRVTSRLELWKPPFLGRAILSDDTEQSYLVARSLHLANGDVDRFRRALRRRLILWLLALPPGVGLGTIRSIAKLMVGFRRGVRTAGNGAAMRSAVIGAALATQPDEVELFVRASTELTHTDPRAFVGAYAVALAAGAHARNEGLDEVLAAVEALVDGADDAETWHRAVEAMRKGLANEDELEAFVAAMGWEKGILGYVYYTVPAALYAWARYADPEQGLEAVWRCGGDTDTVGAIAGALLYARAGVEPSEERLACIRDFPLTVDLLRDDACAAGPWFWPLVPLRNLLALSVILAYGVVVHMPRKYLLRG
jgi:ADP-ribosylglycohydrolase